MELIAKKSNALKGKITVPGDKSISHRALLIASQAIGKSKITGLLEGEDVINTAKALGKMGVGVEKTPTGWVVNGVGVGGLVEPDDILDMGNSGTGCRLLIGLVSSYNYKIFLTGDASLRKRPMARVTKPLEQMGVDFVTRSKGLLPLCVIGSASLMPVEYELPVASAQVKSAILLAALNTAGITTITEPEPTRDHTELMFEFFGVDIKRKGKKITIKGQPELKAKNINVPADPSSAAFLVVAALVIPGSDITIRNVCINPLRTGLFTTLKEMGAKISFKNLRKSCGEKVADINVKYSKLKGVKVLAERAPSMIDEYPILAVAASFAQGKTIMHGLKELRVKESDRLKTIYDGLAANGVKAKMGEDSLEVEGPKENSNFVCGGGLVKTHFDHRIAMAFLVMGLATEKEIQIDDATAIATSFPNFVPLMKSLGAKISGEKKKLIVAIDGPAASGKGTLSRRVADYLGAAFLDTGSIYRAVGLQLVYHGKDAADKKAAIAAAKNLKADDLTNPRIRQEKVARAASVISSYPEVREILLQFQRDFAARPQGAVLDGRDIGTVVCPNADIKIFITADLETRARRRYRELMGEGVEVSYSSVLEELQSRDERDSKRSVAPLYPAKDAVIIDTTNLSAEEVFARVKEIIKEKLS